MSNTDMELTFYTNEMDSLCIEITGIEKDF